METQRFSAQFREQIDKLEANGIKCKVVPGVTALLGAAADMNLELTLLSNTDFNNNKSRLRQFQSANQ